MNEAIEAPTPTVFHDPAGAEKSAVAEEAGGAALKALFVQLGLGALCVDVCRELGVDSVDDRSIVTLENVDALPNDLKVRLKGARQLENKLLALLGLLLPAACQQNTVGTSGGATRHEDRVGQQQVFLGYRVASDADLVERLYYRLKAQGVNVWWDKRCLPAGQPWEQGFADGLCNCDVIVPVLSKEALARFADLTAASTYNNVLLEHQLALELQHRGHLRAIFPVLVGELETHNKLGDIWVDFSLKNGISECSGITACQGDVVVEAVEGKLVEHLERLGKGAPQLPRAARTVKATLDAITCNQGVKLEGMCAAAVDNAVYRLSRLPLDECILLCIYV